MSKFDFKFHTNVREFSGMGVVEAANEKDAENAVRAEILNTRPDVTIREIVIEPSVLEDSKDA